MGKLKIKVCEETANFLYLNRFIFVKRKFRWMVWFTIRLTLPAEKKVMVDNIKIENNHKNYQQNNSLL